MDTATGSGLMEEFELMKQAKYRVYMQNIDKALKNFEYSSEWADLISALGKLNKVRLIFCYHEVALSVTVAPTQLDSIHIRE